MGREFGGHELGLAGFLVGRWVLVRTARLSANTGGWIYGHSKLRTCLEDE